MVHHANIQSTEFKSQSSSKFKDDLDATIERDSLSLNGEKSLLTGNSEKSHEIDQIHSLILVIQEI